MYTVKYETNAEAVRRSLPPRIRISLRLAVSKIAAAPRLVGSQYGPPGNNLRSTSFGPQNRGLIVYRLQDDVVLITIINITWI